MEIKGTIFDIQRFSIHDGPGIRTTVFFKGCPLNCLWCHNPESINKYPELSYDKLKCIGCNLCLEVCSQKAIINNVKDEKIHYRERCLSCWQCVQECPANALKIQGEKYNLKDVFREVKEDLPFYEESGGGVTLSGGEPTVQIEFCRELLKKCKSEGIHTALDTSGYSTWNNLKSILPFLDLILFDLKHMEASRHKKLTGVSNQLILDNLTKINREGIPVDVRIPVIPGYNDSKQNLSSTANFINNLENIKKVTLLKYHQLGLSKPWQFNQSRGIKEIEPPSDKRMEEIEEMFIEITGKEISYR
ncbi:MAG: glycyl-radical enzyme activating protein [bacterium]